MQNWMGGTYSSYAAITPSSTTPLNTRAIFVPTQAAGGTVVVSPKVGGTLTTFTFGTNADATVLPIELNQGIVDVTSTATGLVALQ